MHWHIILTERCNSRCTYCYGKSMMEENDLNKRFNFDFNTPTSSNVNTQKLKKFLEKDSDPVLAFYGGEPLLQTSKIKEIIDNLEDVRFVMQTNAKLLDRLDKKYLQKIDKLLVSIDGTKERTDFNRGIGSYDRSISNLKKARSQGYEGEIVARMTIEFPDIYKQVKHLITLINEKIFDSIHWQLDMGFYQCDFNKEQVEKFVKIYNSQITQLINFWIEEMEKGRVLKLYPFLGIFESLYYNKKTKLRCGSGYTNYTITTDGNLTACPIMGSMTDFYSGNLESDPKKLKKFHIGEPCTSCNYLKICGGRCLYANKTKLWPKDGEALICKTIIHLIDELKNNLDKIKSLIQQGKIKESDFKYEKYFGPEIIP